MKFTKYASFLCSLFTLCSTTLPAADFDAEYDYIIVGVGTAGGVMTKLLSDNPNTSVLALHMGQNFTNDPPVKYCKYARLTVLSALLASPVNRMPEFVMKLPPDLQQQFQDVFTQLDGRIANLYQSGATVPDANTDGEPRFWVMALPEGGASSINAGVWVRGTDQIFAQWEAIAGPNWSPGRITSVYKSLEKFRGKTHNTHIHGYHGPVAVRGVTRPITVGNKFSQAIVAGLGVPFVLDFNDPNTPIGSSTQIQITQRATQGKLRVSSATAFLNKDIMTSNGHGVKGRRLRVLFESTALRTLWQGNRAAGVEFLYQGQIRQVSARKGVVVCAGIKSSPFLLHSGIGPSSLLSSLGIPVIFDNPNVGQGLADQPHVVTVFTSNPKDTPKKPTNSLFAQIAQLPAPGGDPNSRQLRFTAASPMPGVTLGVFDLVQPLSRGYVTINSPDPLAPPVINLGELSNPSDLALFLSGMNIYVQKIAQAISAIDPLYQLIFPDPAILNDPVALTAFIKENIESNMHFQSHCRMAPLNQGGVVDSFGRVYGVSNLYVADDSVVPQCTDGSPMPSAMLIAANIAAMIIQGH